MIVNEIKVEDIIIIELVAENGLVLCDGLDYCNSRMLSVFDKQENWTEITEEEAIEITNKNKKLLEENIKQENI